MPVESGVLLDINSLTPPFFKGRCPIGRWGYVTIICYFYPPASLISFAPLSPLVKGTVIGYLFSTPSLFQMGCFYVVSQKWLTAEYQCDIMCFLIFLLLTKVKNRNLLWEIYISSSLKSRKVIYNILSIFSMVSFILKKPFRLAALFFNSV